MNRGALRSARHSIASLAPFGALAFASCGSAPPENGWRLAPAEARIDSERGPLPGLPKANGIALADFSGDGRLDIAAVNGDPGQLLILLNQGNGRFAPFQGRGQFVEFPNGIVPLGEGASGIALGDLDGNGWPDIVISHHDSWEVTVILSNGDGTFQPRQRVTAAQRDAAATPHAHNLALAELNGDGQLDLLIAQAEENAIIAALGNGRGGFAPAVEGFATGAHPYTVTAADFNGDGRIDVAAPNADSNDLTIGLGDGRGGFAAPASAPAALPSRTLSLAAGDINGDGHCDLVGSSDAVQRELSLLFGDGAGGFTRARASLSAPARVYGHAVADINRDGLNDVIAPSIDRRSIMVWLATDPAELRFQRLEFETPGVDSQVIAIGDVNGDGIPDVVSAGWEEPMIAVLLGQGTE